MNIICNCITKSIHTAAFHANFEVTQQFLDDGVDINTQDDEGFTPLILACTHYRDNVTFIEYLIQLGADINMQSKTGETAIHSAAYYGHIGMVTTLLSHGVNILVVDKWGDTPLHEALQDGGSIVRNIGLEVYHGKECIEVNKYLDQIDYRSRPIVREEPEYYQMDFIDIVKLLLRYGADIHIKNNSGYSALDTITSALMPDDFPVKEVLSIFMFYENLNLLREWRPWNHSQYPCMYRMAMRTIVLLSKTKK